MSSPLTDEKALGPDGRKFDHVPTSSSDDDTRTSVVASDVDAAWLFLDAHRDAPGVDAVDMRSLRRKIDWRIVPLMFCCYTMQFLDKVIYNVSRAAPTLSRFIKIRQSF